MMFIKLLQRPSPIFNCLNFVLEELRWSRDEESLLSVCARKVCSNNGHENDCEISYFLFWKMGKNVIYYKITALNSCESNIHSLCSQGGGKLWLVSGVCWLKKKVEINWFKLLLLFCLPGTMSRMFFAAVVKSLRHIIISNVEWGMALYKAGWCSVSLACSATVGSIAVPALLVRLSLLLGAWMERQGRVLVNCGFCSPDTSSQP